MDIDIPDSVTTSLGMKPDNKGLNVDLGSGEPAEPKHDGPGGGMPAGGEPEPKEPLTAAQKRILKIKVDGQDLDFDATDDDTVRRVAEKAHGADKKFQEAAQARKEAQQLRAEAEHVLNMIKDPASLKKLLTDPKVGIDLKKFAEDYVWEQMQEAKMTPEQRQARDAQAELDRYRQAEANQKQTAEQAEFQRAQTHYEGHYEKTIMSALEAGGLPKSISAIRRMAGHMQLAIEHGLDLQPADLVERVRQDLIEEHKEMYGKSDGDSLRKLLGNDLSKKLRESDLKQLRSTQPEQHRRQSGASQSGGQRREDKQVRKMTGSDWREDLTKRLLGE